MECLGITSFQAFGIPTTIQLYYNGYLRSNPDTGLANNLNRLPEYDYDWKDPLFSNLYDGTFYFVEADMGSGSLKRHLYHRAWHLPLQSDPAHVGRSSEARMLNGFMVLDQLQIPLPYKIVLVT